MIPPSEKFAACAFVFASLVFLSALSCILGTYYDDEIYNIKVASLPYQAIIKFINQPFHDVHPAASYILNKITFGAFDNWKAVQLLNGTLNAVALAWFYYWVADKLPPRERFVFLICLSTAATVQMWATSLRWYAYFNPIFIVLYTVALSRWLSIVARAATLAAGSAILFYISYLALVASPILWASFILSSAKELTARAIARIILILVAATIFCLPQLYVFTTAHLLLASGQTGSILFSAAQSISTLTIGNAVFPLNYIPGLFFLFLAAAAVSSVKRIVKDEILVLILGGVLVGVILLVFSGVGVKGRNAVFLYPAALVLVVTSILRSTLWIRLPALSALVVLHLSSVYGFVFHLNTAKGSYNTPFSKAVEEIGRLRTKCPGRSYNFTHDPVLTYLLEQIGDNVSSPYHPSDMRTLFLRQNDCVIIAHTYHGAVPVKVFMKYSEPLDPQRFRVTGTIHLGYDRFHELKARIGKESFPEFYLAINVYEALNDVYLPDWRAMWLDFQPLSSQLRYGPRLPLCRECHSYASWVR
jgi:hypothetical protein